MTNFLLTVVTVNKKVTILTRYAKGLFISLSAIYHEIAKRQHITFTQYKCGSTIR